MTLYSRGSPHTPDVGQALLHSPHPTLNPVVHQNKVSDAEKAQLVNETRWQYYGTAGTTGTLSLTWDSTVLSTPFVRIELWGYDETGKASAPAATRTERDNVEMRADVHMGGSVQGRLGEKRSRWDQGSGDQQVQAMERNRT